MAYRKINDTQLTAIAEAIRWADRQLAKYGARLVPVQEA